MLQNSNIHYLKFDYRAISLDISIKGLSETIDVLKGKADEIHWYDGDWFLEESEPIYGLVFIVFQNYINGSIKDIVGSLKSKGIYYNLNCSKKKVNKSNIELVIGLANYSKHKDEGIPHKGTKEILDFFALNYVDTKSLDNSPIFQGLTLLNKDWNLFEIKCEVKKWRELLYEKLLV